jgi:hypothetical protein
MSYAKVHCAEADLSTAPRTGERHLGKEVNATIYSPEEFREKVLSHDHFP